MIESLFFLFFVVVVVVDVVIVAIKPDIYYSRRLDSVFKLVLINSVTAHTEKPVMHEIQITLVLLVTIFLTEDLRASKSLYKGHIKESGGKSEGKTLKPQPERKTFAVNSRVTLVGDNCY